MPSTWPIYNPDLKPPALPGAALELLDLLGYIDTGLGTYPGEKFESARPEALTGQWQGVFKLRVGDYRVLYACKRAKQKIVVHFIRHRREVYKIK